MARAYRRYMLSRTLSMYKHREALKLKRTLVRKLKDPLELPEEEFVANYRVSSEMVKYLCEVLDEDLAPRNASGYSTVCKVLASLKVLLNGHYQKGVGNDDGICVAQTTVSKYFNDFLESVYKRLTPQWIQFPGTPAAREQVAARFEELHGLPHVLGCVNCTNVSLFPPPNMKHAENTKRRGITSINVQLIADADCRILNVNANHPGHVSKQLIFDQSVVKEELRQLHLNKMDQYFLLGDSTYALEPWLMTPIHEAEPNSPEECYNKWHCRTSDAIERTSGFLKGTFKILAIDHSTYYERDQASKILYVCCTLYNVMKHFRVPMDFVPPTPKEEVPQGYNTAPLDAEAVQKRTHIVKEHFSFTVLKYIYQ